MQKLLIKGCLTLGEVVSLHQQDLSLEALHLLQVLDVDVEKRVGLLHPQQWPGGKMTKEAGTLTAHLRCVCVCVCVKECLCVCKRER